MASYLLTADEAQMDAWKAAAATRELSFAAFCREALTDYATRPPKPKPVPAGTFRGPDPKPTKAEKPSRRR